MLTFFRSTLEIVKKVKLVYLDGLVISLKVEFDVITTKICLFCLKVRS